MKTRTVNYRDGRTEIVQILDSGRMSDWSSNDPLAYEASIMWLTDVSRLPFVRSLIVRTCDNRSGKLMPRGGGRVVGYAKLTENAPLDPATGRFARRVFYLREDDLQSRPGVSTIQGATIKGAIDPRTILPGVAGDPILRPDSVGDRQPVLVEESRPAMVSQRDRLEDEVTEWLADAVAPTLSSVRPSARSVSSRSQSLIDTEVSHDAPLVAKRPVARPAKPPQAKFGQLLAPNGKSFPLNKERITIGRDQDCDLVIRQSNVSGVHCELARERGLWFVKDLGSTNGTCINGVALPPRQQHPLDPGVTLSVGKYDFEVQYDCQ